MENINKIEIMLIAAPVVVYWFYIFFLLLTELSQHEGIEISVSRKITVTSIVLVPLVLLWGLGALSVATGEIESMLGIFAPLADYIVMVLMLCTPAALLYTILLFIKHCVVGERNTLNKYQVNSSGWELEEDRLDREFEETRRRDEEDRIREGWQYVIDYENGMYN